MASTVMPGNKKNDRLTGQIEAFQGKSLVLERDFRKLIAPPSAPKI